jgi:hypothetical protein
MCYANIDCLSTERGVPALEEEPTYYKWHICCCLFGQNMCHTIYVSHYQSTPSYWICELPFLSPGHISPISPNPSTNSTGAPLDSSTISLAYHHLDTIQVHLPSFATCRVKPEPTTNFQLNTTTRPLGLVSHSFVLFLLFFYICDFNRRLHNRQLRGLQMHWYNYTAS